jgi:hypothetical protein
MDGGRPVGSRRPLTHMWPLPCEETTASPDVMPYRCSPALMHPFGLLGATRF